jgi:penicillin amidase
MTGRLIRRGATWVGALLALIVVLALAYVLWVWWATRAGVASWDGTRAGVAVEATTTIARDARGVAHIRAGSVHDAIVAEGYAMASDRLFQMDVTRRFVDGRLAEMLGSPVVRVDRRMRRYGIRELAARVYAAAAPEERALLDAFAVGVNAAAVREPTPPEYRAMFFGFEPWKPEDALAVGFATVLDLDDKPDDVIIRDYVHQLLGDAGSEAFYPLTDPRYDVPTNGRPAGPIAALPALPGAQPAAADLRGTAVPVAVTPAEERPPVGSNGWVAGADRTTAGKAVLANDPHLSLAIPAIWWLVEINAPGLHVAGAALAGTPGVTLGHNEHLAWGVTAGETAAMIVRRVPIDAHGNLMERIDGVRGNGVPRPLIRHEQIGVRFGAAVDAQYLEDSHGVVIARPADGAAGTAYVMDWRMRRRPVSPLAPFLALLRARTAGDGVAAMRALPEPALNVLFADDTGAVAYHFAGGVPLDPTWGRWASDSDAPEPAYLAYDDAPHVGPSRNALVVTSNNRSNGIGSPRLAPYWPPPYRAFEITRALKGAAGKDGRLTIDALAAEQRDARSPAEHEFADRVLDSASRAHAESDATLTPLLTALHRFDGMLVPASRGATAVVALRRDMLGALAAAHLPKDLAAAYPGTSAGFEVVLRMLREHPHGWVPKDDYDAFVVTSLRRVAARFHGDVPEFGTYASQPLAHPLAQFGLSAWNGPSLPGRGGSFSPAVQWNGHGQSFRAVWIAGDWDKGTIDIDAGESGEPGSPHYYDQSAAWIRFERTPLPFSEAAVRAATVTTLTLTR